MIAAGSTLTDFTLQDDSGTAVQWSSLRGKPVVIFAYPRADTPGCTKEACAFRDLQADFAAIGVAVYGISADKVASQYKFRAKYGLTIPLLSDPEKAVLGELGAWGEKMMYGKKVLGILRSTFLFDAAGVLVLHWPKVQVEGHAEKVLAAATARFVG